MTQSERLLLTPGGLRNQEAELALLLDQRREIAARIRDARSHAEPGENSEYEDAKQEQSLVESRIARLKEVLATAAVLDPTDIETSSAGLGCRVLLYDVDNDEQWEVALVSSVEADPDRDLISTECPLGEALVGRVPGDQVELRLGSETVRYTIRGIRSLLD